MRKLLILLVLILLINLISCVTGPPDPLILQVEQDPVEVTLEITYPYTPRLDLPEFPAYPQDMGWDYDMNLQRWTLPDNDMDRLIAWRVKVEGFPEKVGIVYFYYSDNHIE